MNAISRKLTESFVRNGIIKQEDKEIYSYGINMSIQIAFVIITTLLLGLLFDRLAESIIIMTSYFPLRSYAGGYHAGTQFKCNTVSVLIICILLLAVRYLTFGIPISLGVSFFAGTVIYMTVPVEDCNKPLDHTEYIVYRKRARMILIIEMLILITAVFLKAEIIYVSLMLSITLAAIMLIAGLFKNSAEYNKVITSGSDTQKAE